MTDTKISALPLRSLPAATDEVATVAEGVNYRSSVASIAALGNINGIAALRARTPVHDQIVHLNYHTTVGDLGGGDFRGVTTGGLYTDNDGTTIVGVDTAKAWLRIWDGVRAHVGWFGAVCTPEDLASDDTDAVRACLALFTDGRTGLRTGIMDVGPGFNFSEPLIYGGVNEVSFKLVGQHSLARGGQEKSLLRYTGPATVASVIFYGAADWWIEDINFYPDLALNGVFITADNSYNHTTTHTITAGANVVVTPSGADPAAKVQYLQVGVFLGVDAGGDNFEIVYITAVDTVAGTFTATFTKSHANGVQLGGGRPSSSGHINRCRFICPTSPIWTTLTAPTAGGTVTFNVGDATGILVGHPVRVGSLATAEILFPLTVGASSFTAVSAQSHASGDIVMYPTAGILFGNRLTSTVQVDCVWTSETDFVGALERSYAGVRQMWGGNVKAFLFHRIQVHALRIGFAFEFASAQYHINGGTSSLLYETIVLCNSANLTVQAWEDESAAMWLIGQTGSNPSQATFIGCTFQGNAPTTSDEMVIYGGNLTFISSHLRNGRVFGTSLPVIVSLGVLSGHPFPSSLSIIGCHIEYATLPGSAPGMNFVRPTIGSPIDVGADGTGKFTLLNCIGGLGGAIVRLPDILPPQTNWQGTVTYDPVSLTTGAAGAIQTMAVIGAVLGDLVEASFSLNLQGVALRAWVSAADTVSYQFHNPTAGTIDLASGTVKCRVKK